MGKIAFVFSGQGSQFEGMGKDLYDEFSVVRDVFDAADSIRPFTSNQCFESSMADLSKTLITQPCMFSLQIAISKLLSSKDIFPDAVAGFSLGEVAALCLAEAFEFADAMKYIVLRAESMDKAANAAPGKMAAVLKLDASIVEQICADIGNVWPVNYNCPGQTVVSGMPDSVDSVMNEVLKRGGKAIQLAVSGAFHSPMMEPAYVILQEYLSQNKLSAPKLPIYLNIDGDIPNSAALSDKVSAQVINPVLWTRTIESMKRDGISLFVEIGPGKVLSGLIKKIDSELAVTNIQDVGSFYSGVELISSFS